MSTSRLIAIVVTFNRLGHLQKTVSRLLGAGPEHLAGVIIVDNASTDGTADWLKQQNDARLNVLSLDENVGGAGGFAAGMREAMLRQDPDWLVLMDDDARPARGAFATFHASARDQRDVWAAASYFPDGGICDMNRPLVNPFKTWRNFVAALRHGWAGYHVKDADYQSNVTRDIDGAAFVGYFVSRAAVQLAGYPDPKLFIYGDDVLYSLKLNALGGTFAFDPKLRFEHDCEADMGTHPITPIWKVYYMYRNQLFVYRKAAGPVLFWPVALLKIASWRRRARAYGAQSETYKGLWRKAILDGLKGRKDVTFQQVRQWSERGPNA